VPERTLPAVNSKNGRRLSSGAGGPNCTHASQHGGVPLKEDSKFSISSMPSLEKGVHVCDVQLKVLGHSCPGLGHKIRRKSAACFFIVQADHRKGGALDGGLTFVLGGLGDLLGLEHGFLLRVFEAAKEARPF